MALDIKPTRSELIKLKARIKQTKNGYKLLKMKRDGLFHEFRQLLSKMIEAKRDLTDSYRLAKQRIDLANAIEGAVCFQQSMEENIIRSITFAMSSEEHEGYNNYDANMAAYERVTETRSSGNFENEIKVDKNGKHFLILEEDENLE